MPPELGARLHAVLLDQPLADPRVGVERFHLSAAVGERPHEEGVQAFSERVHGDEAHELGEATFPLPERDLQGVQLLLGGEPAFLESIALQFDTATLGSLGERAAGQGDRPGQSLGGVRGRPESLRAREAANSSSNSRRSQSNPPGVPST